MVCQHFSITQRHRIPDAGKARTRHCGRGRREFSSRQRPKQQPAEQHKEGDGDSDCERDRDRDRPGPGQGRRHWQGQPERQPERQRQTLRQGEMDEGMGRLKPPAAEVEPPVANRRWTCGGPVLLGRADRLGGSNVTRSSQASSHSLRLVTSGLPIAKTLRNLRNEKLICELSRKFANLAKQT